MGTLVVLILAILWQGNVSSGETGAIGAYLDRVSFLALVGYIVWVVIYIVLAISMKIRNLGKDSDDTWDVFLMGVLFFHRIARTLLIVAIAFLWGSLWFGAIDVGLFFVGSVMLDIGLASFFLYTSRENEDMRILARVCRGISCFLIRF